MVATFRICTKKGNGTHAQYVVVKLHFRFIKQWKRVLRVSPYFCRYNYRKLAFLLITMLVHLFIYIRFTKRMLYAHNFKIQFSFSFDSYINRPTVYVCSYVTKQNVKQPGFAQTCFPRLSDVDKCSGGL